MSPTRWPGLIPLLALAACGGKGAKEPAEQTGTLQAGQIQGVEWQTPTRSGTTDANGRFTYLPGESVTFSIGDVELGTAAGAPHLTLFTLAGLTPPTTERALRRQLDLAMRSATPFTRAINLDLLLIALDADANPDNGVDVRGRTAALTGVALDFDRPVGEFGSHLYSTVPSLVRSIPAFKPVAHLYGSLGLRVPVHARTRIVEEGEFALFPTVQTFHYRADGALETDEADWNADGVVDTRSRYEYDAFGRLTRDEYREDFDFDQADDRAFAIATQFDARGTVTGSTQTSNWQLHGPRQTRKLVEHVVDAYGRTTRQVVDVDLDDDGVTDERQVDTVELQARQAVFTTRFDDDADAVIDSVTRTTEHYDARHRVLTRVAETDVAADGVVDMRSSDTYVYDDFARTVRSMHEDDDDADDSADSRSVFEWRLDGDGNVVMSSWATEPDADGHVTQRQTLTREFDRDRRVTGSTSDHDLDGDGIVDERRLDATTFDDVGNVTGVTHDYDVDADGVVESSVVQGYEYGAGGELLGGGTHYDWNGDRRSDFSSTTIVSNEVVDDGVLLLTQGYFRTGYAVSAIQ
jgi:hypothetical protein